MIKRVTFFGFSEAKPEDKVYQEAFEVAKLLAKEGYEILNGGGPGIMKASSLGAKEGGGKTIGVSFYPAGATHFEGRDPSNPLDEEIKCANYVERTIKLIDLGDVYVIFSGGTGTVSEFGMAWGLARIYFGNHKPFLLFGSFWHEITEAIGKNMLLRPEALRVYKIVTKPQEVLEAIQDFDQGKWPDHGQGKS
jgi:uncharacterized protein (TIGR00725 family)